MRPKRLTELFMLRLDKEEKERLQRIADELCMNATQLALLSIRESVNRVRGKLAHLLRRLAQVGGANVEWKEIDMRGRTARLKGEDSKSGEPWVLPLSGRL